MDEFGNLDQAFATNGILRADFPSFTTSSINQAVYHPSGIYFIGQGYTPSNPDTFAVFIGKLTLSGQLDVSFGLNGFFTDDFLGTYNTAGSLIIDSQNKIVFCGSTTDDQGTLVEYAFIGRLDLNGNFDSSFGTTGLIVWDTYGGGLIDAMEVRPQYDRHGDGAYLSEILEINNNYFVAGKYVSTSYAQLHYMSITKQGEINPDFISQGPQIFQVDPGYNHWLQDIAYDGKNILLAIRTDGYQNGNNHLLQLIDTTGVKGDLISLNTTGYTYRTNFIEYWNDKYFIGGYRLNNDHNAPGYHSDDFNAFCLDEQFNAVNGFQMNENMNSNDELGAKDLTLHNDFGVMGGFMNVNIDTNYTDLAFMAFEVSAQLSTEDANITEFSIYPNPSSNFINTPTETGQYAIFNQLGEIVLSGVSNKGKINIQALKPGIYYYQAAQFSQSFVVKR